MVFSRDWKKLNDINCGIRPLSDSGLKHPGFDTAIPQKSFDFSISLPQTAIVNNQPAAQLWRKFPAAAKTVHINGKTCL
jgi:hypothetical protein